MVRIPPKKHKNRNVPEHAPFNIPSNPDVSRPNSTQAVLRAKHRVVVVSGCSAYIMSLHLSKGARGAWRVAQTTAQCCHKKKKKRKRHHQ